jgi:hypothetical protein
MTEMALEGHQGTPITIDLCAACQAFWFDRFESLKLAPGSTLKLMQFIGENAAAAKASYSGALSCPRCAEPLQATQDLQRNTRFSYWRCRARHGRFIRFFDFLKEKDFLRPLTSQQIAELRRHVQSVNCSNCGAPVNLAAGSACGHCKSPLSMLDMKQPEQLLKQLEAAAVPKPVDPTLPMDLARAKRDVEGLFGREPDRDWLRDVTSSGLVQSGLKAVARWLSKVDVQI